MHLISPDQTLATLFTKVQIIIYKCTCIILFQTLPRNISALNEVDSRPPSVFSMTQDEREKVRDLIMGGACTVCVFSE